MGRCSPSIEVIMRNVITLRECDVLSHHLPCPERIRGSMTPTEEITNYFMWVSGGTVAPTAAQHCLAAAFGRTAVPLQNTSQMHAVDPSGSTAKNNKPQNRGQ
jgi:hypothetical protein